MRGSLRTVLLVGLALGGCKSSGDPDVNVDQENLCDEVAEVACHDMFNCCSEGEIENILNVDEPRTQGQCGEDIQVLCERALARLDFSVANGRSRFDAEAAETCLKGLVVEDECGIFATALPWDDDCVGSVWVGLVADGGQCFFEEECAGADSFCGSNRICTPLPTDGQLCPSQQCATGLFCNAGTCRPRRAATEACANSNQCATGLYCDQNAEPEPVCAPLHALGEACPGNGTCQTSLVCVPGVCAGTTNTSCFVDDTCSGRCADDGAPCGTPAQCQAGTCSVGLGPCLIEAQCNATPEDTCMFTVACNPPDCVGTPVCGEQFFAADYCEDAIDSLPVSLFGNAIPR